MLTKNIVGLNLFCSQFVLVNWLQNHLIPCPFKSLTGIDCPGCGFQRSVLAFIQGDFHKSFSLYPATVPLILFFLYGIADKHLKLDTSSSIVKKAMFIFNGSIITLSYIVKLWSYAHYKTSA